MVNEEIIEIMLLSNKKNICKMTNCKGGWTLKFISTDEISIETLPLVNAKMATYKFKRQL